MLVLNDVKRTAVGHIFRVGDRVPLQPRLDQPRVGVLVNRRNRRFAGDDLLRFVVIRIAGFRRIFLCRLVKRFVIGCVAKTWNIAAAVGG